MCFQKKLEKALEAEQNLEYWKWPCDPLTWQLEGINIFKSESRVRASWEINALAPDNKFAKCQYDGCAPVSKEVPVQSPSPKSPKVKSKKGKGNLASGLTLKSHGPESELVWVGLHCHYNALFSYQPWVLLSVRKVSRSSARGRTWSSLLCFKIAPYDQIPNVQMVLMTFRH